MSEPGRSQALIPEPAKVACSPMSLARPVGCGKLERRMPRPAAEPFDAQLP